MLVSRPASRLARHGSTAGGSARVRRSGHRSPAHVALRPGGPHPLGPLQPVSLLVGALQLLARALGGVVELGQAPRFAAGRPARQRSAPRPGRGVWTAARWEGGGGTCPSRETLALGARIPVSASMHRNLCERNHQRGMGVMALGQDPAVDTDSVRFWACRADILRALSPTVDPSPHCFDPLPPLQAIDLLGSRSRPPPPGVGADAEHRLVASIKADFYSLVKSNLSAPSPRPLRGLLGGPYPRSRSRSRSDTVRPQAASGRASRLRGWRVLGSAVPRDRRVVWPAITIV